MRGTAKYMRISFLSISMLLVGTAAGADFFDSDAPLSLVLEAPMNTLVRDMKKKPTVEGVLSYTDGAGKAYSFKVKVNTRGNTRLEFCDFPPLKVDFRKKEIKGTPFEGHGKLKIGTLCKRKPIYETYHQQEYLIYKAYNQLSDASFQTRYFTIEYRDTQGKRKTETQPGYFIENPSSVAGRNGMVQVKDARISPKQYTPDSLATYTLFAYMIGVTDWSVLDGPPGEECCHNGKVIGPEGEKTGWVPVPYDFDQAGLIDTKYAKPHEALPIRKVTQRLWRGFCMSNELLPGTIAHFQAERSDIQSLFQPGLLDPFASAQSLKWISEFYEIVGDPRKLKKDILGRCRK